MGTCDYCGNKTGIFETPFHRDCKDEHVEKGMQLIAEGIALKCTKYTPVILDELSEKDMINKSREINSK